MTKLSVASVPASPAVFKIILLLFSIACYKAGYTQPVLTYTPFIQNLSKPVEVRNAGDGSGRLFVVEQTGKVKIYKNGALLPKPFFDISNMIGNSTFIGIWSIAFSPNFKTSRIFFVLYTGKNSKTELVRYQASSQNMDSADLSTRAVLLSYDGAGTGGPHFGQMHFGADRYLYVTISDGSSPTNTTRYAQDGTNHYGKMLRLNVNVRNAPYYSVPPDNPFSNTPGILPEIWAFGFRNAWRWSFDYKSGNMWLPDIGGEQAEELNLITPSQPAGLNFGWPCVEGNFSYLTDSCGPVAKYTFPKFTYRHDIPTGGQTFIGGYVYRGVSFPSLKGNYVCSDFSSNNAWVIRLLANGTLRTSLQTNIPPFIESYGLDEAGEMYAAALDGKIYKVGAVTATTAIAPASPSGINNSGYTSGNRIFPTVVNSYIMLQLNDVFSYVRITDMSGHEVLRKKLNGNKGSIQVNLPSLSAGMYIVQLAGEKNVQQKIYVEQ